MSFRLFVYYCALCGAWAALAAWAMGRSFTGLSPTTEAAVQGLCLGLTIGFVLGLVDALWNFSLRRPLAVVPRALTAALGASGGGLAGGVLAQLFFTHFPGIVGRMIAWGGAGLLIGSSLGMFDFLAGQFRGHQAKATVNKLLNGLLGGVVGGVLGGTVLAVVGDALTRLFPAKDLPLRFPEATSFAVLGACIGLFIGLAQVILKEAWIQVVEGFRPGRALLLTRPEVTIGRAESCDLGLFGDPNVQKLHARIVRQRDGYLLITEPGTTLVNEQHVGRESPLRHGDRIRIGRNVLVFGERRKR